MPQYFAPRTKSRTEIRKAVVLRPGALGDVLVVRGVIRFLREMFPGLEVTLVAPGERGRFFRREGWADVAHDWDRAAFGWLFAQDESEPPGELRAVFSDTELVFAFVASEFESHAEAHLARRLSLLAPDAVGMISPARPRAGENLPIGEWLVKEGARCCVEHGLLAAGSVIEAAGFARTRVRVAVEKDGRESGYLALHPGSGSGRKNWPLEHFSALARRLLVEKSDSGGPLFSGCVVTSGEADGDLGERLARMLPDAAHVHDVGLDALAGIVADAKVYAGNDSGVSHLAAAVESPSGLGPKVVAIFGDSDAGVWTPPGALVVQASGPLPLLLPDVVFERICAEALANL